MFKGIVDSWACDELDVGFTFFTLTTIDWLTPFSPFFQVNHDIF